MRLGSFCTGYGGLDMAVEAHYGAHLAWCSEVDKDCNQRNDETCLPGAILALPSPDGSESSDGQHPNPPTTENSPAGSSNG